MLSYHLGARGDSQGLTGDCSAFGSCVLLGDKRTQPSYHSQVLEAPGLNTRLCWTRHSSQRALGSHGPHVLELCLSKEPLTHARKEPLPCLPTAGTAPEHPPWHTLGNVGVQGQLCQLQIPQPGAGLPVSSPPLSWGSTGATVLGSGNVQHCVPCVLWQQRKGARQKLQSQQHTAPHQPLLYKSRSLVELHYQPQNKFPMNMSIRDLCSLRKVLPMR